MDMRTGGFCHRKRSGIKEGMKNKVSTERRRQIFLEMEKLAKTLERQQTSWAGERHDTGLIERGGEAESGFRRMYRFGKKEKEAMSGERGRGTPGGATRAG